MNLSESQRAYIAGIIDGEGSITIIKATTNYGTQVHQLRLCIVNTNYPLLKWIKDVVGCGNIQRRKMKSMAHRQTYYYTVCAKKCDEILKQVRAYMIVKREQADIAIEFYKTVRPQKDNKCGRKGLPPELVEYRNRLKRKINSLNGWDGGSKFRFLKNNECEFGEPLTGKADGNPEPSIKNSDIGASVGFDERRLEGVCRD